MSHRLARGFALIATLFMSFAPLSLSGCARSPRAASPCNCEVTPGVTHHPSSRTMVVR